MPIPGVHRGARAVRLRSKMPVPTGHPKVLEPPGAFQPGGAQGFGPGPPERFPEAIGSAQLRRPQRVKAPLRLLPA